MKRLFTYAFLMPAKPSANALGFLRVCNIPQTQYPGAMIQMEDILSICCEL
jgi:hypothetical protein